ncbi:TIMELESS-interacting protein isoform X3 [Gymnodraco acuticeps]|uniref:TIMELESS-interacting protein n=1 Tax=Gymnodraco acuticeps TaxID=8218 RepID=A0A6P8VRK6_GYMAC|nr:TIMELESS-interacting protein isoform X3 [Gymnodraco acuticeps]
MEDGLFHYNTIEDEAFPPLPPPHSPGGQENGDPFGNGGGDGDVSGLADVPAAKRKGVKRPQPKLDSQRLLSERGLPALRTLFDNVRFKGKGKEAEDLRLLMQKMENWAHRLYPKMQFEDFIEKVEKLGNKKDVQTCLKRIRLDMPMIYEDFMGGEEAPETDVFREPDPFEEAGFNDLQRPIHSTPAPAAPPPMASPPTMPSQPALSSPPYSSPAAPSLSEEQRRRMELNRQRALEKRLSRQQQPTDPSDSQTVDSTPTAEPTSAEPTSAEPTSAEPTSAEPTSAEPTSVPSAEPTSVPSAEPTSVPSAEPTSVPSAEPTSVPSAEPTSVPSANTPSDQVEDKMEGHVEDKVEDKIEDAVEDKIEDKIEDQVEDLDLKPDTQEPSVQPPHTDSKLSAASPQCEKQEVSSLSQDPQPSTECEGGD